MATEKRLIERIAERLKDAYPQADRNNLCPAIYYDDFAEIVDDVLSEIGESVDAVEVVHGHWKLFGITGKDSSVPYVKYAYAECSDCREVESSVLYSRRFCPNCGAMKDRWTDETY